LPGTTKPIFVRGGRLALRIGLHVHLLQAVEIQIGMLEKLQIFVILGQLLGEFWVADRERLKGCGFSAVNDRYTGDGAGLVHSHVEIE
jgi:hypothetical protein